MRETTKYFHMNFSEWILCEELSILQNLMTSNQIVYLGKIGLWDAYSATNLAGVSRSFNQPKGIERISSKPKQNKILSVDEYSKKADVVKDPVTEEFIGGSNIVKTIIGDAAYRLTALGFKKHRATLVFANIDRKNPITGHGTGGEARYKEHGFVVNKPLAFTTLGTDVIVHEHAHMYWYNLPASSKNYFKKWYRKNVVGWEPASGSDVFNSHKSNVKLKEKILENLPKWANSFVEALGHTLQRDLDSYFKLKNAVESKNKQKMIEQAVFLYFGSTAKATLRNDLQMTSSGHSYRDVSAGTEIIVEKVSGGYILNYYPDPTKYLKYESDVIPFSKIQKYVKFDLGLLNPKQAALYEDSIELAKNSPYQFLAKKDKKEEIEESFNRTLKSLFDNHGNIDGWKFEFNPEDHVHNKFYSTWASRIGRRAKKGNMNSVEDVKKAFVDSVKSKLRFHHLEPSDLEQQSRHMTQQMRYNLGSPAGNELRNIIAQAGVTPSPYAAANADELWAEIVENASKNINNISKELKDMLVGVLSGTVHSQIPSTRPPRRLSPRKVAAK